MATKLSVKASQLQFVHSGVTLEDFGNDEVQVPWKCGERLDLIGKGWNKVTGNDWNKKVGKKTF